MTIRTARAKILSEPTAAQAAIIAVREIDRVLEECRKGFTKPGALQGDTYLNKAIEARFVLDGGDEEDADSLAEEAAIRGVTVTELAQEVMAAARPWRQFTGKLEGLRRNAGDDIKALVAAAETQAAIADRADQVIADFRAAVKDAKAGA